MNSRERRLSLITVFFSEFIDYAGIAIVYPLFAYMLFDPAFQFLPQNTSESVRGMWLGILIALHPLLQFFCAPLFGALSDLKGRKKLLKMTTAMGLLGYGIALLACYFESLFFLALYRICVGIAAGNCSIVSAIVADLSSPENKAKNYGLLNMAFGAGFTLGPFISGYLAHNYFLGAPFLISFGLVTLNWLLISCKLKETLLHPKQTEITLFASLAKIKQAAFMPSLRFLFLVLLVFSLGWSFFTEFASLYLIDRYGYTPDKIGLYYAYTGFFYAISAGFLITPFIRRWKIERVLFFSMLLSGSYLWVLTQINMPRTLWFYLPVLQFFLSFVYPAICAAISNRVSPDRQGEAMGIYQAVIALALAVTPLCSGFFVGSYPFLVIVVSGALMVIAAFTHLFLRDDLTALNLEGVAVPERGSSRSDKDLP